MILKVCGMKYADNIRQLDEARIAQWMGFIFYPRSPRYVGEPPAYLPRHCQRVGVFVNAAVSDIVAHQADYGLNLVQLHGDESPAFCQALRAQLEEGVQLIKALQVSSTASFQSAEAYAPVIDYFLFETKCTGYGGSGQQFDWTLLHSYHADTPFLLTGGIGPADADKVRAFRHPQFAGIDLNSRFETAPALKDIQAIQTFTQQITHFHEQNKPSF